MIVNAVRRTLLSAIAFAAVAAGLAPLPALAQGAYPTRSVRLIVPFPPGGVSDASARMVAEELGRRLGQQVVVENRPGASGNLAGAFVAQADPDGYTILLAYNGLLTINPYVIAKMPFDTVKDLAPVGKIGDYPSLMAVHPSVDVKTVQDVVALSKSRPNGLDFGTSGPGSNEHLLATLLVQRTGANLTHVPYKGAGPVLVDAIAGHIPIAITSVAGGAQHVKAGKLKAIAVSSAERSPSLPDVPTFIESGIPDFVVMSWIGLIAPGKTPKPVVARLNADLNAALASPELREKLAGLGIRVTPGTPEAFHEEIKRELERNAPVVKAAGLKAE